MTRQDFDAGHDGMHVPLTCENHPELRWSCKKIALSLDAAGKWRYNHSRHIFYSSDVSKGPECECDAKYLYAVLDEDTIGGKHEALYGPGVQKENL